MPSVWLKLRQNLAGNNPGAVPNVVIVLEMDKSGFLCEQLWDSGKLGAGTPHPHPVTGDMGHRCGAQHSHMSLPAHSPGQGQPCPQITHYTHKMLCNSSHSPQFPPTVPVPALSLCHTHPPQLVPAQLCPHVTRCPPCQASPVPMSHHPGLALFPRHMHTPNYARPGCHPVTHTPPVPGSVPMSPCYTPPVPGQPYPQITHTQSCPCVTHAQASLSPCHTHTELSLCHRHPGHSSPCHPHAKCQASPIPMYTLAPPKLCQTNPVLTSHAHTQCQAIPVPMSHTHTPVPVSHKPPVPGQRCPRATQTQCHTCPHIPSPCHPPVPTAGPAHVPHLPPRARHHRHPNIT